MLLRLPTGRRSAPTFTLVDTTGAIIDCEPYTPRVPSFSGEGAYVKIGAEDGYVALATVDRFAETWELDPETLRAAVVAKIEIDRKTWRAEAEKALDLGYRNAQVIAASGHVVYTHATEEEIVRAIEMAHGRNEAIARVEHTYAALPTFDERGPPTRDNGSDDAPF